jgi:integrase
MEKRKSIPSMEQYQQTIKELTDKNLFRTLIAVRMGCEMGLTRIEIVNAKLSDLDRLHNRSLWVEIAKKVRRGTKIINNQRIPIYEARSREIPVNLGLYALMKSFSHPGQIYVVYREKGDMNEHLTSRCLNTLYEIAKVPWSTHKSRHFFKNRVLDWMRENRQIDEGLLADLLGHKKTQTQQYGSISWDYKLGVIDKVFK